MESSMVPHRGRAAAECITRIANACSYVSGAKSALVQRTANPAIYIYMRPVVNRYLRPVIVDLLCARLALVVRPTWSEQDHGHLNENDVMAALLLAVWRLAASGALVSISILDFLQLFGAIGPFTRFTADELATPLHEQYLRLSRLGTGERDLCLLVTPLDLCYSGALPLN